MTYSSLMVVMKPGAANGPLLDFTADLVTRVKVARAIGVAASQPLQLYGDASMYSMGDIIEQDLAGKEKELRELEAQFDGVLKGKASNLEWRSTVTYLSLADYVAENMRAADLLITTPDQPGSLLDPPRRIAVADLAMRIGRPMLVVGPDAAKLDLSSVLVAWKDSREARRAVEDALPLLKMATQVTVVEAAPGSDIAEARARLEDVVGWLKHHEIRAASKAVASSGDDAAHLSAIAQDLRAGLIVGGAYGHNRLREWILGGVTRDLLLQPARCALVSH